MRFYTPEQERLFLSGVVPDSDDPAAVAWRREVIYAAIREFYFSLHPFPPGGAIAFNVHTTRVRLFKTRSRVQPFEVVWWPSDLQKMFAPPTEEPAEEEES